MSDNFLAHKPRESMLYANDNILKPQVLIISYRCCSYYTLMMWFPELFNRFETFERQKPGVDVSVCQVSSVYIEHDGALNTADLCGAEVGESVYSHTLWIGIACIPTSLWMPLCVHRLGAKFFLGNNIITGLLNLLLQ